MEVSAMVKVNKVDSYYESLRICGKMSLFNSYYIA